MSDKGSFRAENQDRCAAGSLSANACYAVVCDGMGGEKAGDVAARLAIETIASRITSAWRDSITLQSVENILASAVAAANIYVYDESHLNPGYSGMGTTVVAAVVLDDGLVVAHAGDSRAYLVNSVITQLTEDHSYVQSLVSKGLITPDDARRHPDKNLITRALGVTEHIDTEIESFTLAEGDKVLLCTDGVSNFVEDSEMFEIVTGSAPSNSALELITRAIDNSSTDNVTAVVLY